MNMKQMVGWAAFFGGVYYVFNDCTTMEAVLTGIGITFLLYLKEEFVGEIKKEIKEELTSS